MPELKEIRYGVPREEVVSAKEKRKQVVRQVIKPLLKEAGFRTKGNRWKRGLEDGWLLIHLINGSYGSDFECEFELNFGAFTKEKIGDTDPDRFWIHGKSLYQSDFLPYYGAFTPFANSQRYYIRNYFDRANSGYIDIPVESYIDQVRKDLETYVLPRLAQVKRVADWEAIWKEKWDESQSQEDRWLLRYYFWSNHGYPAKELQAEQKKRGLTRQEILSNLDWWLENMRKRQEKEPAVWIADDLRERILAALEPKA